MFNIYGPDLVFLGELEGTTSAAWSDYWDEIGGINITAALNAQNEQLLQNGFFVEVGYLPGAPGAENEIPPYLICDVQRNAAVGVITANGKTADFLLRRRGVPAPHFGDTTIPDAARAAIENNLRGLPLTVGNYPGDSRSAPLPAITLESATADEIAFQLLRYGGYGRQLRRQGNQIAFLIDAGRDKRYTPEIPVFSDDTGAAIGPAVGDDDSSTCNVATAALHFNDTMPELAPDEQHQGNYEDGAVVTFSVGDTGSTGTARRELWCGDIFQNSDESNDAFRARARAQLEQSLQENIRVLNLNAEILPKEYGTVYRTGDLLRARAGSYSMERRVTGVNWSVDATGTKCSIRLGPPTINVLREQKKSKPMPSAVSGGFSSARAAVGAANKKILDLHRKWLNMTITIGEVSAGLTAEIQNFDEFKQASASVYAKVDKTAAGLDLIATEDVLNQLKESRTTLYAKVDDELDGCVKQAYLELYAVKDASGNSRTFAELAADSVLVSSKRTMLNSLSVDASGRLHTPKEILADGLISSQLAVYAPVVGCERIVIDDVRYDPVEISYVSGISVNSVGEGGVAVGTLGGQTRYLHISTGKAVALRAVSASVQSLEDDYE